MSSGAQHDIIIKSYGNTLAEKQLQISTIHIQLRLKDKYHAIKELVVYSPKIIHIVCQCIAVICNI